MPIGDNFSLVMNSITDGTFENDPERAIASRIFTKRRPAGSGSIIYLNKIAYVFALMEPT